MPLITIDEYLTKGFLCCPACLGKIKMTTSEELCCQRCGQPYSVLNGIPAMLNGGKDLSHVKRDIQVFWQHLYEAAYSEYDKHMTKEYFLVLLNELEIMFRKREHLAVTEMPLKQLQNKEILEIGCGSGAHSALFAKYGAHMTSMDITLDRVVATAKKLEAIDNKSSFVLQGDAENLPFCNETFDIVYSNGVLHHIPDTQKAIDEIWRVLKFGGKAIIMLYAKHSFDYWINSFLVSGILRRNIFKHKNWLGRVTEWMGHKKQEVYNPITKVFSSKDIHKIFKKFKGVKIRKNGFSLSTIPKIGKYIDKISPERWKSKGGILVYGAPYRYETKLEFFAGKYIGFDLNISAIK